jgi:putative component of membrane protein insertase Oxa1/YidC/SpoIIIJ protein YidD
MKMAHQGVRMKPGRLASICLRIIERYQRSHGASAFDKNCRFAPSCCAFMAEAFSTRAFPIAFALSAGRLMRCNPLVRPHTHDPVHRSRALVARPNGLRTAGAAVAAAGLVVLLAGAAHGQSVSGGCTAFINGRSVTTMTRDNPLVVNKGQVVSVMGTVPAEVASLPREQIRSVTRIDIAIIDPIVKARPRSNPGTGPQWGSSVNVDRYLEWGGGLYKVTGEANINTGGVARICRATAYIEMNGSQVATAVAGGLALAGGAGTVGSPGRKKKGVSVADLGADIDQDLKRQIPGIDTPATRTVVEPESTGIPCCSVIAVMAPLAALGMVGAGGGAGAMPRSYAPGTVLASRRVWKRGHPILGFLSGLLLGLGITVVLQQQGVWILNVATGVALPVATGLAAAIRGWYGRAYRVSVVAEGVPPAGGAAVVPGAAISAAAWTPTHRVVARTLQAWAAPDPAGEVVGELVVRTEVRVVEQLGDWARVDAENGWSGWVNAQGLKAL